MGVIPISASWTNSSGLEWVDTAAHLLNAVSWLTVFLVIFALLAAYLLYHLTQTLTEAANQSRKKMQQFGLFVDERALIHRQLAESKGRESGFLDHISHEIRTPLAGILGYSELLLFDQGLSQEQREAAEHIKKCSNHLTHLVDNILDVSSIQAGKILVQREPTRLMNLLHEVVGIVETSVKEKNLAFEVVFDSLIPDRMQLDPLRVRQILLHLIGNAVKFTDHGKITLSVAARVLPGQNRGFLELTIIDTGCGIALEFKPMLFKKFSPAQVQHKIPKSGSGLGLYLSQTLAEQLGGKLELVDSVPGRGSTFRCTIAIEALSDSVLVEKFVQARPLAQEALAPSSIVGTLNDLSILVVEDGIDNQRILSHFLTMAGAQVMLAKDGMAALEKAGNGSRIDLILMDIQLPLLDGYEVTDCLRKSGFEQPIIAVTAQALHCVYPLGRSKGISDYLAKPLDIEALIKTIMFHVGRKQDVAHFFGKKPQPKGPDSSPPKEELAVLSKYYQNSLYKEVIIDFVNGLEQRLDLLQSYRVPMNRQALGTSLHQLKGAAGSYGFPVLAEIVAQMELALNNTPNDAEAEQVIRVQADTLAAIVDRMKQGLSAPEFTRVHS